MTVTLERLAVSCACLAGVFKMLKEWLVDLEEFFSIPLFVFGPKTFQRENKLWFYWLFLIAKLAIRKSKKKQTGAGLTWPDTGGSPSKQHECFHGCVGCQAGSMGERISSVEFLE